MRKSFKDCFSVSTVPNCNQSGPQQNTGTHGFQLLAGMVSRTGKGSHKRTHFRRLTRAIHHVSSAGRRRRDERIRQAGQGLSSEVSVAGGPHTNQRVGKVTVGSVQDAGCKVGSGVRKRQARQARQASTTRRRTSPEGPRWSTSYDRERDCEPRSTSQGRGRQSLEQLRGCQVHVQGGWSQKQTRLANSSARRGEVPPGERLSPGTLMTVGRWQPHGTAPESAETSVFA